MARPAGPRFSRALPVAALASLSMAAVPALTGAGSAGATTAAPTVTSSPGANPNLPIDYKVVGATTTLAKLHQTVHVPTGSFKGSLNTITGALTGNLVLPPAKTTVRLAGIGLATATFKLQPTAPVTGTVNFSTLQVTATASFDVLVPSAYPLGLPVNVVGNECGTATPVHVTFSGTFSFTGSSTFSGTYTIPPWPIAGWPPRPSTCSSPGPATPSAPASHRPRADPGRAHRAAAITRAASSGRQMSRSGSQGLASL